MERNIQTHKSGSMKNVWTVRDFWGQPEDVLYSSDESRLIWKPDQVWLHLRPGQAAPIVQWQEGTGSIPQTIVFLQHLRCCSASYIRSWRSKHLLCPISNPDFLCGSKPLALIGQSDVAFSAQKPSIHFTNNTETLVFSLCTVLMKILVQDPDTLMSLSDWSLVHQDRPS